jgi:glutamate carboxypeptidase
VSHHEFAASSQRRLAQLLADLETLVCTESPSEDLNAVRKSALVVADVIRQRLGAAPELIEIGGRSHVRMRWGTGPRRVLILAHHDTVWPIGTLEHLPWSVADGVIRGPGCFDMKLGLAQAIHALGVALESRPQALDGVTLLVTGDEELGSPTSRQLIETEARGCSAVFVLEASADGGALKTARKGVALYQLTVAGRAAHAGLEPETGINAAVELAHQLLAIAELGDAQKSTTVTPTVLRGGTTSNTVPERASVWVDVRAWDADELRRVDVNIRSLTPVIAGSSLMVEGGINRLPLEGSSSASLFERAQALARQSGLPELRSAAVGGASDGNFTAGMGVPTLDGLGAVGGGAHSDTEHALVQHIPERVALLALLIQEFSGARR